jgi:hypothetical protein
MDYVSDSVAAQCSEWEARFKALPKQAGVLFVSVKARPSPEGGDGRYHVVLGLDKALPVNESTGMGIVMKVLEKELGIGLNIEASVYLGR